jgi:serine phosphatase RsbU (regulator of sigma subunit)/anti-sigma regulatory factor (Ser/Thr protein kinase)
MGIKPLRILLVEDQPTDVMLIRHALREILEEGGRIEESGTLSDALDILGYSQFDVLLLDLGLPDSTGLEGLKRIKEKQINLPILILTGHDDAEIAIEAVQIGAQDYIYKGKIDNYNLPRAIDYAIERYRLLQDVEDKIKAVQEAQSQVVELYSNIVQELKMASEIQSYFLPRNIILEKYINFCSHYSPSSRVGGDLYDISRVSDSKYYIGIGDISGHGVQAALLMTAIRSILGMLVETGKNISGLADMANRLNEILCQRLLKNNYMTLILGVIDLDKQEFRYLNAGHPPVISYERERGSAILHQSSGSIPIGWDTKVKYKPEDESVIQLKPGSIFILYTDGLFECENSSKEQLGIDGLMKIINTQMDVDDCLLYPHKLKARMEELSYEMGMDDYAVLTFQPWPETEKRRYLFYSSRSDILQTHWSLRNMPYATYHSVEVLGKACEQIALQWTGDSLYSSQVELLVNEYLNNIIQHGIGDKEADAVVVELAYHDGIKIRFIDEGKPWSPDIHPGTMEDISYSKNYIELPESGWGMKIVQSQSSAFERKRYDKYNETVIKVKKTEKPG